MNILWLVFGLTIVVLGSKWLVKGAANFSQRIGISPLIVGLTIVAMGTSAPEFTVSVISSLKGSSDLALGNVVGSNILNVLLVLGICALLVPLNVHKQILKFDAPIMIGVSVLVWLMAKDSSIHLYEGITLLAALSIYLFMMIRLSKSQESPSESHNPKTTTTKLYQEILFMILGLTALVVGSKWFVESAQQIARNLGVSELVIGLTIVAAGTSLPEIATSITAAFKGERDIAVGNVVGSNIFNIVGVLGASAVASPNGLSVSDTAKTYDIPVMLLAAGICIVAFSASSKIGKRWGTLFLIIYAGYMGLQIHMAQNINLALLNR